MSKALGASLPLCPEPCPLVGWGTGGRGVGGREPRFSERRAIPAEASGNSLPASGGGIGGLERREGGRSGAEPPATDSPRAPDASVAAGKRWRRPRAPNSEGHGRGRRPPVAVAGVGEQAAWRRGDEPRARARRGNIPSHPPNHLPSPSPSEPGARGGRAGGWRRWTRASVVCERGEQRGSARGAVPARSRAEESRLARAGWRAPDESRHARGAKKVPRSGSFRPGRRRARSAGSPRGRRGRRVAARAP